VTQDVRTACQTACPTGAIVFGDRNNKQGDVAGKRLENELNYLALEEINTQSAVFYAARVHNRWKNSRPNLELRNSPLGA
jgi:Fe-S-cluster-containing dehydrogenase component